MQLGNKEINVRQYLGWFQFKGADQQKKVEVNMHMPLIAVMHWLHLHAYARTHNAVAFIKKS